MELEEDFKEKQVVKKIKELFLDIDHPVLRKMFIHKNLATRKFHEIWSDWWTTGIPPRLEVDMILVFEKLSNSNKVFLVGVEVEYFRNKKKSFYDGLHQILSFGLFGFDSLILWHIFYEDLDNRTIDEYVKPVKEIVEGFRLPLIYFATKMTRDMKFEFFHPLELYSSAKVSADQLLKSMRNISGKIRNPLLNEDEIENRKKTMKLILKIPL